MLGIDRATHGPEHRVTGLCLYDIAELETLTGDTASALRSYDTALGILTDERGEHDDLTVECREAYRELLLRQEGIRPRPSAEREEYEEGHIG